MKLNIEVTDNIGWEDGRSPYTMRCSVLGNPDGRISVGGKGKVNPIETIIRLDDLARQIKDTVSKYYSTVIPSCSESHSITSS